MLLKILTCTFLLISTFSCYNAHFPERPVVAVQLESSGMHRELLYTVQFDYPIAGSDCEYILEQNLSEGIFINIDQLDDLQRLNKLNALYPKFVDVEKPAEKSEKFKVLLIGNPKITATILLPIHLRYFAPQKDKAFFEYDIEVPTLYLHCPSAEIHLIDDDILLTPNKTYCLDHENLNFIPSTPLSTNNCQWHLINMDLQQKKGSLTVQMPVGNANAFKWVLYATIILSWMVSLWTAFHTHSVPQRINHKLQEQRILQNKLK